MPDRPRLDVAIGADRLADAQQPLPRARTLPAEAYTSQAVYQREVERIFTHEWLCAGRADQVPATGDYFTLDLLGDKLVVVRGRDGRIRVLSRVCRHRGAEVVGGAGRARSFQCPVHAWTYRLDGVLIGAPHMDAAENFDRASCRLPELRSELWEGWIFVNFDADAEPLAPKLRPLAALLAPYRMADAVALETAVFDSPFNWKVLVDNFMEAYHHIGVHRETFEPLFPAASSYAPDNEGPYSLLVMPGVQPPAGDPMPGEAEGGLPYVGELGVEERNRLVAAVVYPFHLFAPGAQLLTWYQLLPHSWERFTLRIYSCFPRSTLEDPTLREAVEGIQAFTRRVHQEDIRACEATMSGLDARSFESGRLAPLEKPLWQFNQWWIQRMDGGG